MLVESLKGLGRAFVEILSNRLENLSLDLKEDRIRFVSLLLMGASAFFILCMGILLGVFFLVLILGASSRLLVMGILAAVFFSVGLTLFALLVRRIRDLPGAFEGTLSAFYKDREALGGRKREGKP